MVLLMPVSLLDKADIFPPGMLPVTVRQSVHHGSHGLHKHNFYEFVYVASGFSLHNYNGSSTILTAGDLFGMRPGDIHGYTEAHSALIFDILFCEEAIREFIPELCLLPGAPAIFSPENGGQPHPWARIHLSPAQHNDMLDSLRTMEHECDAHALGWELSVKCRLMEFLVTYYRYYNQRYAVGSEELPYLGYIRHALEFVDTHSSESFTVADVATHCRITPDYLSRQFKQVLGLTPVEYIRNFRLARAMALLKSEKAPISVVSAAVGYNNVSHFTREFKHRLGQTPTSFRNSEPVKCLTQAATMNLNPDSLRKDKPSK